MKEEILSKSPIELKEHKNAVTHLISNRKLLTIYKPMDIKDSLKLYVKEMLANEKEKDENS
jgi:hypothetical protein